MYQLPFVNRSLCDGCGLCVDVCIPEVLALVDDVAAIIRAEECGYCTDCEVVCPHGAIECPYEIVTAEYYECHRTILGELFAEG
ncbi:MAG: 4Fe-4S binding protein [Chloroflexi bacterium]|nr:4Fe-4S binding protein [Chloroflexota bacterium]